MMSIASTGALMNAPDSPIDSIIKPRSRTFGIDKNDVLIPQVGKFPTGSARRSVGRDRGRINPNVKSWGEDDSTLFNFENSSRKVSTRGIQVSSSSIANHSSSMPSPRRYHVANTPSSLTRRSLQSSNKHSPSSSSFTGESQRNIHSASSKCSFNSTSSGSSDSRTFSHTLSKIESMSLPYMEPSKPTKIIPGKSLKTDSNYGPKSHSPEKGTPFINDSRNSSSSSRGEMFIGGEARRVSNENTENLNAKSSSSSSSSSMRLKPFVDPNIQSYGKKKDGYRPLDMETSTPRQSARRSSRTEKRQPEIIDLLTDDDENIGICKYMYSMDFKFS